MFDLGDFSFLVIYNYTNNVQHTIAAINPTIVKLMHMDIILIG